MHSAIRSMGRRAAVIIKNVGVNACADPLLQATAQGLIGGVVLVAGDDPDALGSQTAQDSRYYGELAELPVIEPDASTCYTGVEAALEASEQFSRVAMLRLTPPVLDADAAKNPVPRKDGKGRLSDRIVDHERAGDCSRGTVPHHVRLVFSIAPEPLERRARRCRPLAREDPDRDREPPAGTGSGNPGRAGIRQTLCPRSPWHPAPGTSGSAPSTMEDRGFSRTFCRDCPFKVMMNILKERKMAMICDAGCSILGMTRPYELGVASYGMGSSIAVAARSTKVALIGDYALLHSGLNALIDVYEKRLPLLCIVMKNDCTAMTGKQPAYDPVPYLRWADPVVCRADDELTLERELVVTDRPRTLVVEGICPEGSSHETIAY